MDTNTTIIIVAGIFALIVVIGFIVYRRNTKVGIELPGSKMKFEGSNNSNSQSAESKSESNGIFGNLSIGKTRMKVKGSGTIAKNTSLGDTELNKEDGTTGKSDQKSKKKVS